MDTIWKSIKGYEGLYEVSNDGRVRRIAHNTSSTNLPEREKSLSKNRKGYITVVLYKGQEQKHVLVHRLVAAAFIPNPEGLEQVNHKDENKCNNNVLNLEWCSNSYNASYGTRGRRIAKANTNGKQSKPIIGTLGDEKFIFPSIAEASRQLGIARENIIATLKGRRNNAGGYTWEYQY